MNNIHQSLVFEQVLPAAQEVQPVKPMPPHCANLAAEHPPPLPGAFVGSGAVVVRVTRVVVGSGGELLLPPPEHEKTEGPGTVYELKLL